MAETDNIDHQNETRFINHVALRLGLSESDVIRIDQNPQELGFELPKDEQERMNLLYHMLFLMKIDGSVGDSEVDLCHELGFRLGFNMQMVDELIGVMRVHVGKQIPQGTLLDIIKKFMN